MIGRNLKFGRVLEEASKHSHSKNAGLETREKVLLYVFHHVFIVGMCTLVRLSHMGKPNLNNACLF